MKKYKFTKLQLNWINDLISGKYRRTTEQLAVKDDNKHVSYCCLGVACVVAGAKKEIQPCGSIYFDGEDVELSEHFTSMYKLRSAQGALKEKVNGFKTLAEMNDDGWSHKKIGQYILDNPENVFLS